MALGASCAQDVADDGQPPAGADGEESGDQGELVIYSGRSESLVGPIIDQFEKATGVSVSVKYGSTGEIAATLVEEGENTPADVFFAQDPAGLGAVAAEGALAVLADSTLNRVPD